MSNYAKQAVAQYYGADVDEVHTVGDFFDQLESSIMSDVEWGLIVDAEHRKAHYCGVPLPQDGTVYARRTYYDLEDEIVIDDEAIERVAEYCDDVEEGRLHAELGRVEDDTPIEFVGIDESMASLCGVDNADIVGIDQLQKELIGITIGGHGGQQVSRHEQREFEVKERENYGADEVNEYILDRFLYQHADRELIAEYMSELEFERFAEIWYDEE